MTLWLAIIALVLVVNEWIAPRAVIAATHVDDNEQRADVEQAGPASVLDFLVRPPRSNPPRTCEPATKTPSQVLLTCNSALRAPKSERARANHHRFAHQETSARVRTEIPKAIATVDDRPPPTDNRRAKPEPVAVIAADRLTASTSATGYNLR